MYLRGEILTAGVLFIVVVNGQLMAALSALFPLLYLTEIKQTSGDVHPEEHPLAMRSKVLILSDWCGEPMSNWEETIKTNVRHCLLIIHNIRIRKLGGATQSKSLEPDIYTPTPANN